jgi:excisionase family DNA binding protein
LIQSAQIQEDDAVVKLTGTIRLDDYMTTDEAATLLKVTKQTLSHAFKTGRIAGIQIERTVLLHKRSVEEYRRTRRPAPPRKKK